MAKLEIWVVYDHPADFPNHFVSRKFDMGKPTQDYIADKSLTIIRSWLQYKGLTLITRSPEDDPCIIECWL